MILEYAFKNGFIKDNFFLTIKSIKFLNTFT